MTSARRFRLLLPLTGAGLAFFVLGLSIGTPSAQAAFCYCKAACETYECRPDPLSDACTTNILYSKAGPADIDPPTSVGYYLTSAQCGDYWVENMYGMDCAVGSGSCGGFKMGNACSIPI